MVSISVVQKTCFKLLLERGRQLDSSLLRLLGTVLVVIGMLLTQRALRRRLAREILQLHPHFRQLLFVLILVAVRPLHERLPAPAVRLHIVAEVRLRERAARAIVLERVPAGVPRDVASLRVNLLLLLALPLGATSVARLLEAIVLAEGSLKHERLHRELGWRRGVRRESIVIRHVQVADGNFSVLDDPRLVLELRVALRIAELIVIARGYLLVLWGLESGRARREALHTELRAAGHERLLQLLQGWWSTEELLLAVARVPPRHGIEGLERGRPFRNSVFRTICWIIAIACTLRLVVDVLVSLVVLLAVMHEAELLPVRVSLMCIREAVVPPNLLGTLVAEIVLRRAQGRRVPLFNRILEESIRKLPVNE